MKVREASQIIVMLEGGKFNADLSDDVAKTIATLMEMSEQNPHVSFKGQTSIKLNFAVKDGMTTIAAKFDSTTPERPRKNSLFFNLEDGVLSTEHPRQHDMFTSPRAVDPATSERVSQ